MADAEGWLRPVPLVGDISSASQRAADPSGWAMAHGTRDALYKDLAALLDLPEGVVTLGWLCVGWPDERPPAPGLERAGWSRRLPLEEVVLTNRWPAGAGPPAIRAARPGPACGGHRAGRRRPVADAARFPRDPGPGRRPRRRARPRGGHGSRARPG